VPPWLLAAAFALVAALLAFRRSRRVQHKEARPHGFAAIRVLYPDELRPYFGVYSPERADLTGYVVLVLWFTVLAVFMSVMALPTWGVVLVAVAAAALASAAAYAESRSRRIIGPDVIAYVSLFRSLSWSLPLLEVTRCEVVPGSPTPRLRVCTRHGSRLLPLTADLWRELSAGYA
jgi:hypothetical protein